MKPLILATFATFGLAAGAQAATNVPLPAGFGDASFRALCGEGGGGSQGCEQAVIQILGGDGDGGGRATDELRVQDLAPNADGDLKPSNSAFAQFAYNDLESYAFNIAFNAANDTLTFVFDIDNVVGTETLVGSEALDGFSTLFIRTNGRSPQGDVTLSNLVVDGLSVGSLTGRPGYIAVTDLDANDDFAISGNVAFAFGTGVPRSSPLAEFKFTDYTFDAAPVPLPAGLPLLLAGLGAFGVARRFRSKAA
jgi:hypothetical protein